MPRLLTRPTFPPLDQPFTINRDSMRAVGLVAAWLPMQDRVGPLRDLTLGGANLPVVSTTTFAPSVAGLGLLADAAGEGALLTSMPAQLRPTTAVTVAWLGVVLGASDASAVFAGALYDNVNSDPFTPYTLGRNGSNLLFWTGTTTTGFDALTGTGAAPADGSLAMIVGTFIAGDKRLYVNGALVASSSSVVGTINYGATAEFSIGASSSFSRNINANTLEVLVYNRVLSPQEVWQLWAPQTRWELYRPAKWRTIVQVPAGGATQTVSLLSLSPAERFGDVGAGLNLAPLGIVSTERAGAPGLGFTLLPSGIGTQEQPGAQSVGLSLQTTGLSSVERPGVATLAPNVQVSGLTSVEAFGAEQVSLVLQTLGIESAERFGAEVVTPGAVTVATTGLASAEQFGDVSVSALAGLSVVLTGLASAERFGAESVTPGAVTLNPLGLSSAESFGSVAAALNLAMVGLPSQERAGSPALGFVISPTGLISLEQSGLVTAGLNLVLAGLGSAEQFGDIVNALNVVQAGIASGERFGASATSLAGLVVATTGIASAERLGTPSVTVGPVTLTLVALSPGGEFGLVAVQALGIFAILTVPLGGRAGASRRGGSAGPSRTGGQYP